jgi:hypothetical protein
VTRETVEEAAYQWTGVRLPYDKIAPAFVSRIEQILTPVLMLDRQAQLYKARTTESA